MYRQVPCWITVTRIPLQPLGCQSPRVAYRQQVWLVTSAPEPPPGMQRLNATAYSSCSRRAQPCTRHSLCHRVQSVALNLRVKLLEDTRAQRVPELWGNKMRQLHVRIGLVGALWQHIVVQ